jgi:hypothetical protein
MPDIQLSPASLPAQNGGYLRACSNIIGHASLPLPSSGPPAPATWLPPAGGWPGCPGPGWLHRESRAGREGGAAERIPAHGGAQAPWPYPGPACRGHRRHTRARIADRARRVATIDASPATSRHSAAGSTWSPALATTFTRGHHRSSLTAHRTPKACHSPAETAGQTLSQGSPPAVRT